MSKPLPDNAFTVGKLIEKLKEFDPDLPVLTYSEYAGEHTPLTYPPEVGDGLWSGGRVSGVEI